MAVIVKGGHVPEYAHNLFICSPQLLLQMSYFLSVQLFLYPEVYIFFLSLVLSCPGDLARERTLSSVFFILFSFSLCQIGAGQFHPLHVSVICASVCSLKHTCVCFKAKTKAKLWSWGFTWLVPSLKMFLSLVDTVLVLTVC